MDWKQDLETEEMWSDIERVEPKMTPRLRAHEVGVIWWHEKTTGVGYFGKFSRKTDEEKLRFGLITWQNIGRHPLRDKINSGSTLLTIIGEIWSSPADLTASNCLTSSTISFQKNGNNIGTESDDQTRRKYGTRGTDINKINLCNYSARPLWNSFYIPSRSSLRNLSRPLIPLDKVVACIQIHCHIY